MIFIDNREKSRIPELLKKYEIPTENRHLEVGDYVILGPTRSACISLKNMGDYLGSIHSDHLHDECMQISHNYDYGVFIVYGNLQEELIFRKVQWSTYFHYLAGIVAHRSQTGKQGAISVVNFQTDYETSQFLKTLHNIISTDDIYREPTAVRVKVSEANRAIMNVSSLPGVGPIRAKALLQHFKSIRSIYNATQEQLVEVEGIGKIIAKNIIEFINKECCYKEKNDKLMFEVNHDKSQFD